MGFISVNHSFNIQSRFELLVLLIVGTFLMYWADHIIDIQIYGKNISTRHFFLSKIKKSLLILSILLLLFSSFFTFNFFHWKEILTFLIFGCFLLVYLLFHKSLNKWKLLKKEILISLLYSMAICFQSLTTSFDNTFAVFSLLTFTVFYSITSVSIIELNSDFKIGIPNFAVENNSLKWTIHFRSAIPFISMLIIMLLSSRMELIYLAFLIIQFIHFLMLKLFQKSNFIQTNYRIISELSFCLQLIVFMK